MNEAMTSLTEQLSHHKAQSKTRIPAERLAVMENETEALRQGGILQRALKQGALCPDVWLDDARGQRVSLSQLWTKGPVVLVFYRGGWCPYCNLQLRAWQRELPKLQARGIQLVAISPQTPDNSLTTAQKNALDFSVLSDTGLVAAKAFGLDFSLSPQLAEIYRGFGIDVAQANGSKDWMLPVPASYGVNASGKIVFASVDVDYRNRAEPSAVLAALTGE
jgi:peroxiredoxin